MADTKDSQSKGANSTVDVDSTDRTTVDKNSEGKFVFENLLPIFHTAKISKLKTTTNKNLKSSF